MDNTPNQRDIVYCHGCEHEWYRDEHGLVCPSCQSDFTEIVEANNDPRHDEQHMPPDDRQNTGPFTQGDYYAPDPDEEDIDSLQWEQTGPGRYRLRGTYRTDIPIGPEQQQRARAPGQGQGQGGIMSIVGNVLQGMLGAQQAQQMQQAEAQQDRQQQQPQGAQQQRWIDPVGLRANGVVFGGPPRPASAPGSPPPEQQQRLGDGTFVRHGHGPGFSYTIASSSNANFGGANLFPRNANAPQPFQGQPHNIEEMISQIFGNIGVMPPNGAMHPGADGPRAAPPHPFHNNPDGFMGGPFIFGGPNGQTQGMHPLANLFQLFGPPGGVAGDAVYSQEALDRIITQLMEQHQTGNAPGPASEAAIKALPIKTISEEDLSSNGKAECSICMDEVPLGGSVTMLPCHHWFHAECIRAWLGEHDTCPHCRQGIMPKDSDANTSQPRQPNQEPMHDMRSPDYTRPSIPGQFPFPRQNSSGGPSGMSGDGTQQNPFTVPDSPTLNRRNSTGGSRRQNSSGGGVFSRMRDAFGRRGSNNGNGNQG